MAFKRIQIVAHKRMDKQRLQRFFGRIDRGIGFDGFGQTLSASLRRVVRDVILNVKPIFSKGRTRRAQNLSQGFPVKRPKTDHGTGRRIAKPCIEHIDHARAVQTGK